MSGDVSPSSSTKNTIQHNPAGQSTPWSDSDWTDVCKVFAEWGVWDAVVKERPNIPSGSGLNSGSQAAASSISVPSGIPKFYEKPPSDDDELQQKLREEARSTFLQKKSKSLLDNNELKFIWSLLEKFHTSPDNGDEKMIDYADFKQVAREASAKAAPFFTPVVFAKLRKNDPLGRISVLDLFNYIMRKTWLRQSRIGLSLYDMSGQGYLTEKDLDLYMSELLPTLPRLEGMDEAFHSFYICTAVRKFMFFLDPLRQGRIRIVDVLASGFLDDLLELRESSPDVSSPRAARKPPNWFSSESAMRVYADYLNLDEDRNGLLSKAEMARYNGGSLTDVFVDRLYQECLTYKNEIDYKTYLDFVLAQEYKKDPSALQYFFRLLDIRHQKYIDAFVINYFFRAIIDLLEENDQPPVFFEDIKDEIFDMVKPKLDWCITLKDLIDSNQGDVVVNILTDYEGFMTYENREVLATEEDEDLDNDV